MTIERPYEARRLSTGVAGLDDVLKGGITEGSVFIVQGPPGAGKTVLGNQMAFRHAAGGEHVLYITLLAESHDRLIQHMRQMSFFDSPKVGKLVYYMGAFDVLAQEGLPGILRLLRTESKEHNASLIVLDGLFVLEEHVGSDREFRKFLNQVTGFATLTRCTLLLLTNTREPVPFKPEHTMVDGWIQLDARVQEHRTVRDLVVRKYRGSDFIEGRHALIISEHGITVYPRLEALPVPPSLGGGSDGHLSSGIGTLDQLLGGGLHRTSNTLLFGPMGIGKTTFGLHFLAAATPEAPALMIGFYEGRDALCAKAASLGIDIAGVIQRGALELLWHPSTENLLDQLGHEIIAAVNRRPFQRLFVDGLAALEHSALHAERLGSFLTALTSHLRAKGVTSLYTQDDPQLVGGVSRFPFGHVSAVAENVVLLRYLEAQGRLERTVSVVKVRDSAFDATTRLFTIESDGIRIGPPVGTPPGSGPLTGA